MKTFKLILIQIIFLTLNLSLGYSQSRIDVGLGISNSHISVKNEFINSQNMWGQDFNVNYYGATRKQFLYNVGIHYQSNEFATQFQNGTTNNYHLSYLRLPASMGYLAMDNKSKLTFMVGPYIGLLLNAKEKTYLRNTMNGEITSYNQNNIKYNFKNIDLGLQMGVQLGLKNGLSFNGKYWYSINKINYNFMNNGNMSYMTLGLSYDLKKLFNLISAGNHQNSSIQG